MERLNRRLTEIRKIQKTLTAQVLCFNMILYVCLLLWFHGNTDSANKVYTNTFQYQAVAWCCWFMLPYFLRVEAKQDMGVAMGMDTVDLMDKIDDAIASRLKSVDDLFTRVGQAIDQTEKGDHPLIVNLKGYVTDEMEKLRAEIRGQRGAVDDEIAQALDEGQAIVDEEKEAR
jgi:hypothetical protein